MLIITKLMTRRSYAHTWKPAIAALLGWLLVSIANAQSITPIFVGTSPPIDSSSATLTLNSDLQNLALFQWQSDDSILGNIDTGEVQASTWNLFPGTGSRPDRLIFIGFGGGVQVRANVLLAPYNRAVVDLTKGRKRVRYLLTNIKVDTLDLNIHMPPVIDSSEAAVADTEELTTGAQTFVNLDNDDRDSTFDTGNTDSDVNGEDEMSKLTLKLGGNNLTRGEVKITVPTGSSHVNLWREAKKVNRYEPGTVLKVPDDFTVTGNILSKQLWVEGIAPHTSQQGTKLKMEYNMAPQLSDEVALTVIGVESVAWAGKNNSRNSNNELDADANHPAGLLPSALRVFPDARVKQDGTIEASARDKVDVRVTLSVTPVRPVKLYLDSFDVDDPSDDKHPVDRETNSEDNRGTPKTGKFTGESAGVIEKLFTNKMENVEFQVTLRAGDNFRVVANGDKDFLLALRNDDGTLGNKNVDKLRIIDPKVAATGTPAQREIRDAGKYASDVLTVWRFLHVEADSMGVVAGNQVKGNITALVPPGSGTATRVNVDNTLRDGSRDLDSVSAKNGRFEKGSLVVAATTTINAVDGNGRKHVKRSAGVPVTTTPLPFAAIDNDSWGNATLGGTVTIITDSAGKWLLKLNVISSSETPTDWPDFKGGTLSVAAGPKMAITDTFPLISSVEVSKLRIPYTMTDDDAIKGDVTDPDTSGIAAIYQPAYIVPLFDTGKDNGDVPFVVNSEDADIPSHIKSGKEVVKSTERYWAVTALNAYQRKAVADNDPNNEGTPRARAVRSVHGVLMAVESIRDWIATPKAQQGGGGMDPAAPGRQTRYQEILNHEIGHLFTLAHADGQKTTAEQSGGVMNPTCCPPDDPNRGTRGASTFTRKSLDKIRDQVHPGK